MIHIIHTATLYDILKAACEKANEMQAEKDETIEAEIIITEATEIMAKLDAYKASHPSSYNIKMFGLGNYPLKTHYTMKENLMKQFALATIDKVQEMKEAADKVGLYLSVDVNLATESALISIYELDAVGRLKTPSIFLKHGSYLDKPGCKNFALHLQEAADFIANYNKESLASLEKEQAELRERLAAVNKGLRKARRAAK